MPVLPSWGTHRVYATYRSLTDGSWLAGTVTVSLPVDVHSVTDDAIIPKGRHLQQDLNVDSGSPSLDINVPASDDPDNLPQDFYVEVSVQLTNPRVTYTYRIPTPLGGETNLRTILDPTSVTVDGPLYVGVAGGLARLSEDGTTVLDADGNPISTGGTGGTDLTTYSQVSSLPDYPATFPADLSGYVQATDARLSDDRDPTAHRHPATELDGLATVATSGSYNDLTDRPTAAGGPEWGTVTGTLSAQTDLQAALDGKQDAGDYATGAQGLRADGAAQEADLADVATTGDYADLTGTPTIPSAPGDVGAQPAGEYATLVGGVIPTSQIPALAITSTHVVADEAAMLALTDVQPGDVAIRPDGSWILSAADPSVLTSWTKMSAPGEVQSVNGQTGAITLSASDVGATPAAHASNTANPHSVTKAQVDLGSVDNVSAADLRDRATHTGTDPVSALPAGSTLTVLYNSGWPARPTTRTDVAVVWRDNTGATVDGDTVTISPAGMGPLDSIEAAQA